jgi:hypothetical protein
MEGKIREVENQKEEQLGWEEEEKRRMGVSISRIVMFILCKTKKTTWKTSTATES